VIKNDDLINFRVFLFLKLIQLDFCLKFVTIFFINFGLNFDLMPLHKQNLLLNSF